MPLGRVSPLVGGRSWRGRPSGRPPRTRPVDGERTRLSRPIGPLGVISAPRNSRGLPESRSRESRPTTRRPLNLTAATAGGATHRPAVRRPDPSALLAGTPTRISRTNRVGPSGQLFIVGAQEVAVKAAFPLARRVCPAHAGWNYLHGISGDEPRLGPSAPEWPPVQWHRNRSHGTHVRGLLPGAVLQALAVYARKVLPNRHLLERRSRWAFPACEPCHRGWNRTLVPA
jgi:hypothetical protein